MLAKSRLVKQHGNQFATERPALKPSNRSTAIHRAPSIEQLWGTYYLFRNAETTGSTLAFIAWQHIIILLDRQVGYQTKFTRESQQSPRLPPCQPGAGASRG